MNTREIIEKYYRAFNQKDYSTMLGLVSDNILHEPNQGEVRKGKKLFEEFVFHLDEAYDEQLTDFIYYESPDRTNHAAVRFTVNGKYLKGGEDFPKAIGQSYTLPAAAFLEVDGGKITKVSTFYNLQLWIKLVS